MRQVISIWPGTALLVSSVTRALWTSANVKFGGKDMKTLYVTARASLYAVPMEAVGHVFPAGGQ